MSRDSSGFAWPCDLLTNRKTRTYSLYTEIDQKNGSSIRRRDENVLHQNTKDTYKKVHKHTIKPSSSTIESYGVLTR